MSWSGLVPLDYNTTTTDSQRDSCTWGIFIYLFYSLRPSGRELQLPAPKSASTEKKKRKKKGISAYLKLRDGAAGNPRRSKMALEEGRTAGSRSRVAVGRECPCALGAGSGAEADRWTETEVSGLLPLFHAGGPGCGDCQRVVNYLNQERGDGNGCICHTSS